MKPEPSTCNFRRYQASWVFAQVVRTVKLGLPFRTTTAQSPTSRPPIVTGYLQHAGPLINSIAEEPGSHRDLAPRVTGIDHPAVSSARYVRVSPGMEGGE